MKLSTNAFWVYWDMFDTRQDGTFGLDIWSHSLDTMVNTFGRYPNGRGNREKNDGWGCALIEEPWSCWPSGRDDRTMWDYRHHLTNETGGQDPLTILSIAKPSWQDRTSEQARRWANPKRSLKRCLRV